MASLPLRAPMQEQGVTASSGAGVLSAAHAPAVPTPAVLVVDEDASSLRHCGEMLEELGYRHYAATSARQALECLGGDPSIQILMAAAPATSMKGIALIEEIRARAGDSQPVATVLITETLTAELALKGIHLEAVDILRKPFEFDACSAALRRAKRYIAARSPTAQGEVGQQLAKLITVLEGQAPTAEVSEDGDKGVHDTLRAIIGARNMRTRYFTGDMFADPAWDILLDLARAEADGQQVSVSSVCIAASVPMSTALRWVRSMTEAGLLSRWTDPKDRRRDLITLTEETAKSMKVYLAAVHSVLKKV